MRLVTTSTGYAAFAALALLTIALPLTSGGCGRTACFEYSQAEYNAHGQSCPAQAKALPNFTDPHCAGAVISVDSAGDFSLNGTNADQSLCCYAVTQQDIEQTFAQSCTPQTGSGGAGGAGGFSTSSFDVSTSFAVTGGVGGGIGGCFSCAAELMVLGAPPQQFCQQSSADAWSTLETCVCGGACSTPCGLDFCQGATMSKECFACVQDSTMSGCGMELASCDSN